MSMVGTDTAGEVSPAELIAADGDFWPRGLGKTSGRKFYVIQSRTEADKAHWTTDYGCTCKGFFRRGRCAHVEAVRIYEAWRPTKAWINRSAA